MTTETVCVVPSKLLERWRASFAAWDSSPSNRMAAEIDALLAQSVASEPVAFVGGDEVQRFMTWAPDKPAFIHPIGTPLYVSPPALAIQDLIALDRQYIAGFSAGWNAGVTGDEDTKRLAINGRLAEIHAVLAAPQPTEGSTDE